MSGSVSTPFIKLRSKSQTIVLPVRLDGKTPIGKCKIPRETLETIGPSADVSPTQTPEAFDEISFSVRTGNRLSMSKTLNEYVGKQIEGWVINPNETIQVALNGRSYVFVADSCVECGVVVPTTTVKIAEVVDSDPRQIMNQCDGHLKGFSMIGGLDDVIEQLIVNVRKPIESYQRYSEVGLDPPRGIILFGPPGTGKTLLMKALADELKDALIVQNNSTDLTGPDCDQRIHHLFRHSRQRCLDSKMNSLVIFVDEFDALCPSRDSAVGEQERRAVAAFLTEMDGLHNKRDSSVQVVVIATTNRPHKIDIALRRPGRFEVEIEVRPPDQIGREQILRVLSQGRFSSIWRPDEVEIAKLASMTHGFVGSDLLSLISKSALKSLDRNESKLTIDQVMQELVHVKPSALREHAVSVPKTHWSDIGGYEDVKQQLIETVVWPTVHASHFRNLNVEAPRGVLLFGPPGCSKTMMARAIATESRMNFVSVKGPEIFSKWVGESEQSIRDLFRVARQASPCVIFFDEIDAIATNRGSDDGGVSGRVLTQLLTEMDGVSSMNQVIVVAATNRPQVLDAALIRPGRLDRLIYVGLPDPGARLSIWRSVLSKIPHEIPDSGSESISGLAERTEGYTGAEIVMIAKEAAILCIREHLTLNESLDLSVAFESLSIDSMRQPLHQILSHRHILDVLKGTHPRTDPDLVEALEAFKDKRL